MSWLLVFWGYMIACDEKGVESVAGKIGQVVLSMRLLGA
jgi:hypothetical protein